MKSFIEIKDLSDIFNSEQKTKVFYIQKKVIEVNIKTTTIKQLIINPKCVCCGCECQVAKIHCQSNVWFLNIYAIKNKRYVQMGRDHIIPVSKGGEERFENFQTMCGDCNNLKSDYDLNLEQLKILYDYKIIIEKYINAGLKHVYTYKLNQKISEITNNKIVIRNRNYYKITNGINLLDKHIERKIKNENV